MAHHIVTFSFSFLLHCFIILLHLDSPFFYLSELCSFRMYIFLPNQVNCILLSSFELKAILLISSVKTLCVSLLNLCWVFNISLFFINSLWIPLRLQHFIFSNCFVLFSSWVASKHFYLTHFCPFFFFIFFAIIFKKLSAFPLIPTSYFIIFPPNLSFVKPITFLCFPFSNVWSHISCFNIFCNVFIDITCFYGDNKIICFHIT